MLIAHHTTASAITPHARDRSWVVFLWTALPANIASPIKIAPMKGADISKELRKIAAANAYDVQIIGLIPSADPDVHAKAIGEQYAGEHLHNGWYLPSAGLLAFIQHHASVELANLLAQVHPGVITKDVVDIAEMARLLDVSIPTIRRMAQAGEIPYLRWGKGKIYRFVPSDVIASLQQHGR